MKPKTYDANTLSFINKHNFVTAWAKLEGVFLTPQNDYIARITTINGIKQTIGRYPTKQEATKVYKAKTKEVKKELVKRDKERQKLAKKRKENKYVGFFI